MPWRAKTNQIGSLYVLPCSDPAGSANIAQTAVHYYYSPTITAPILSNVINDFYSAVILTMSRITDTDSDHEGSNSPGNNETSNGAGDLLPPDEHADNQQLDISALPPGPSKPLPIPSTASPSHKRSLRARKARAKKANEANRARMRSRAIFLYDQQVAARLAPHHTISPLVHYS